MDDDDDDDDEDDSDVDCDYNAQADVSQVFVLGVVSWKNYRGVNECIAWELGVHVYLIMIKCEAVD